MQTPHAAQRRQDFEGLILLAQASGSNGGAGLGIAAKSSRRAAQAARFPRLIAAACCIAAFGLASAGASHCRAESSEPRWSLPVDISQGLVFGSANETSRTPYLFSVGIAPTLQTGALRLGVLLAPSYRNPNWDIALGGRIGMFVPLGARQFGVSFAAQGEYLPWHQSARFSLGGVIEAFGLLRIGVWPGYDLDTRRAELALSIGIDVLSWTRLLGSGHSHDDKRH
ncbi:MAG: hypothetical protein RL701_2598 [Pseudomonadota bacterium]